MISLSLAKVAELTEGAAIGVAPDVMVTGPVVIDSRAAGPGALFVALRGEHADGHDFAAAAIAAGAAGVLAERVPELPAGAPVVLVDDAVHALGRLARAVLDRLTHGPAGDEPAVAGRGHGGAEAGLTVIGVTGSSGKTSTKDLIAQVVRPLGPTVAPVGSFNNEIGHPLTVLRADEGTRYLVLEYSARGLGHIDYLTRIAPPAIGVVLNVGTAHIGEFGNRDVVAKAKGELVEALAPEGTAVLNADDPMVRTMAARTPARIVTFGRVPDATIRAVDERLDDQGRPRFTLVTPEGTVPVELLLHGSHSVSNALAAAAAAREVGMPLDRIAEALSAATAVSRWRMEVTERADGVTIVNDAYNANPESMRAALDALGHMARGRRAFAVLGGMAELGGASVAEHEKIGQHVARGGVAGLIAVGADAASLLEGAKQVGSWTGECVQVDDVGAAVAALNERLRPRDVVLVKGSRVNGLERVAQALLDQALLDQGRPEGAEGGPRA